MPPASGDAALSTLDSAEPAVAVPESGRSSNAIPAIAPAVRHNKITIMMIMGLRPRGAEGGGKGTGWWLETFDCESSGSTSVHGSAPVTPAADPS
jgi:hypothetical protein